MLLVKSLFESSFMWFILLISVVVLFSGCNSLMKSVDHKNVNFESKVYGFKLVAVDPTTGTMSPTGEFGFGELIYHSVPVIAGQPFYVQHETYSLWSSNTASKVTIWVGRATVAGSLSFEAVPSTMIKVGIDGIKNNEATVIVK
jgi:hypothetical protein